METRIVDGVEFIVIKGSYAKGEVPGQQVTDWWGEKDWADFDGHVRKLKESGEYGKIVEYELLMRSHPMFKSQGLVIDINSVERHEFKPINLNNDLRPTQKP